MKQTMDKFSPLLQWLERGNNLQSILTPEQVELDLEIGRFLVLGKATPLHKTVSLEAESLKNSWKITRKYLEDCQEILDMDDMDELGCLDHYELELIEEHLGKPPSLAYPLYLMTVGGQNTTERIVYIGKTSADSKRFSGGHSAITKLHDPKYRNLKKQLYLCCVILGTKDKAYLPLEWVSPLNYAEELLISIEAQLTYQIQPELNTHNKSRNNSNVYISLHCQNISNKSRFLHDEIY